MAKSLYRIENIKLAEVLRGLREQGGIVQSVLSERLGRNQSFVSNVELAIRRLDVVELRDYCKGLGIELQVVIAKWEATLANSDKSTKSKKKSS